MSKPMYSVESCTCSIVHYIYFYVKFYYNLKKQAFQGYRMYRLQIKAQNIANPLEQGSALSARSLFANFVANKIG